MIEKISKLKNQAEKTNQFLLIETPNKRSKRIVFQFIINAENQIIEENKKNITKFNNRNAEKLYVQKTEIRKIAVPNGRKDETSFSLKKKHKCC